MSDVPSMSDAVNGLSGLFPRHVGGTRYRVLSIRNDTPTAYEVNMGDLSCTCPDHEYNTEEPEVCDHLAVTLNQAPKRISVEENMVSDLVQIFGDMKEATQTAESASQSIDTVLARLRDVEADVPLHPEDTSTESTETDTEDESDNPSVYDTTPMVEPPQAAEDLQEAFNDVVPDMQVELESDIVWIQTGKDTPDNLDVPGKPEVFSTFLKDPPQVQFVHEEHEWHGKRPGKWWKNAIEPDDVEAYISEVLE